MREENVDFGLAAMVSSPCGPYDRCRLNKATKRYDIDNTNHGIDVNGSFSTNLALLGLDGDACREASAYKARHSSDRADPGNQRA